MLWAKAIEVNSVSCAIDFGRKLADIILDKLLIGRGGAPVLALTFKYIGLLDRYFRSWREQSIKIRSYLVSLCQAKAEFVNQMLQYFIIVANNSFLI